MNDSEFMDVNNAPNVFVDALLNQIRTAVLPI
jgi:hypothetical protein